MMQYDFDKFEFFLGVTMGPDEGWETYPQDVAPTARYFVMPNLRPARYFQFRISSV